MQPFLGRASASAINFLGTSSIPIQPDGSSPNGGNAVNFDNVFFTQAIANPFDMMNSMAFLLGGGVCERFPELKLVFLEANGGWLVPWLERLDHHYKIFQWDVPTLKMEPSAYFRRQCWISFDPDESALAFTARITAVRCRSDRMGVGLPSSGREVSRGDRRARGGDGVAH